MEDTLAERYETIDLVGFAIANAYHRQGPAKAAIRWAASHYIQSITPRGKVPARVDDIFSQEQLTNAAAFLQLWKDRERKKSEERDPFPENPSSGSQGPSGPGQAEGRMPNRSRIRYVKLGELITAWDTLTQRVYPRGLAPNEAFRRLVREFGMPRVLEAMGLQELRQKPGSGVEVSLPDEPQADS